MWKWILNMDIGVANYFLTSLGLIKENLPFLADSQLAMLSGIIATGWVYIPFATVFILAGLESISSDLFEAARVDGADAVQQIWHIAIPLIRRPIGIVFIIIVMFTFRTPAVFFALTRGGPGKATYHLGLFLKDSIFSFLNFGRGAAVGVFITLMLIVFTIPYFYLLFKKAE
jgi:multiple sugar transport system permease protein